MADGSKYRLLNHSREMYYALEEQAGVAFANVASEHVPALADALRGLWTAKVFAVGEVDKVEAEAFYALSRLIDRVASGERTGRFAPGSLHLFWVGIDATPLETAETPAPRGVGSNYSPLHHEIVGVVSDPAASSVAVTSVILPGARWGAMILARAWVTVTAPAELIAADVPERELFFAFERPDRSTNDRSDRREPEWRYEFHRFYDLGTTHVFNANGSVDLAGWPAMGTFGDDFGPASPAELEARRDAVIHRSRVAGNHHFDLYPYDERSASEATLCGRTPTPTSFPRAPPSRQSRCR